MMGSEIEKQNINGGIKMNNILFTCLNDLSDMRKNLIEKYNKGIISEEEMMYLNIIEKEVDKIIKQRKKGIDN